MPNSETKKEKVYQLIKKAIISGQLESSKIFSITELSEVFKVGRTPVREALVMLTSEGLIESIPRFGYQVKSLSVHDMLEIFHLRNILEVEGARLAAERISEDDINLLEENNRLEQKLVLSLQSEKSTHSYDEGYTLNLEFHLIIARASGSHRLASIIENLQNELELVLGYDPRIARPDVAAAAAIQHYEIIESLKRGDALGSQEAMKRHIESSKNISLNRF
jgi:DNA-binding GntR family transcriptional regulator